MRMNPHPSGLYLTDEELELFTAVPPGRVVFETSGPEGGDIWLDTHNVGWGQREDAEKAAVYFGTVVLDREVAAPVLSKNRREEGK